MGGVLLDKLVLLTVALLCAGILCACGDSAPVDVSVDTTMPDSTISCNTESQYWI